MPRKKGRIPLAWYKTRKEAEKKYSNPVKCLNCEVYFQGEKRTRCPHCLMERE